MTLSSVLRTKTTSQKHIRTACIVLPTYNEASNITRTLDSIFRQASLHKTTGVRLHALVVDDDSPDGTAEIVRRYSARNKNVHLLLRHRKNGLGAAYIAGMQHALRTLHPDIIMQMDSDGQHNPVDIYRLINGVGADADIVIGSRYVRGGSVPHTWALYRKILSRAANRYARLLLDTGGAKDCTGGFRAIDTAVLRKVELNELRIEGYAFMPVLLDACVRKGAIVRELPIRFLDRARGESKMRLRDMFRGAFHIADTRMRRIMHRDQ
ncbi:TPA: polyprenol monophosphomannose synthase [Candidatus Woesearchaeota archaeon]|nr:polyprenol monophosphomannose synthase [Candidatus Woesearchaeota archaeon]